MMPFQETGKQLLKVLDAARSLHNHNYNGANHVLSISGLLHEIIPSESSFKVKTNSVIIKLTKQKAENWSFLTEADHLQTEKSKPKFDDVASSNKDPGESLIDLMRKMYEEGDDTMKRTIAKAWTESREKMGMGYNPATDI